MWTNFRVETPADPMLAHMTVNDLWIPGVREWDIELLEDLFVRMVHINLNFKFKLNLP